MLNSQTIGIKLCLMAVLVTAIAVTARAEKATPHSSEVVLQYQESQSRVMPASAVLHGKYLGSGTGTVSGEIDGAVVWDLYEDQTDPQLHRTQFVGRITATDGSSIDFETTGYFVPRAGESAFWNLTSAIYLFSAHGSVFQSLQGALGVWEGNVDTRTFSHRYQMRLLRSVSLGAPASVESVFDTLDADKNGSVGQQEAQPHPTVAQHFASADSNSDGSLSREEFLAKVRPQ